MKFSEELKTRGLIYDVSDPAIYDALDQGGMTFYLGADPTGDSLHVGHLSTYLVAKRLQEAGHQPILVIGGGTGLIGDPSGKSKERNLLTLEASLKNADALTSQVKKLLPGAQVVNNYDWLKTYSMIPFLRDVGKHFNLNQMLAKDTVKRRLESGISFTEFTYQIIQSLDFLVLYQQHQCQLQIGGQDQWGNITAGLELIRKVEGPEAKAYGMVFPLVTKSDGTKFGKTADGAIWLDPEKTSPYAFYQYWVNLADEDALVMLDRFSFKPLSEIASIQTAMAETPHLRHAQKAIAEELTELVHGPEGLASAQSITEALFHDAFEALSLRDFKEAFAGVKAHRSAQEILLIDALVATELAPSKSQARTLIKQNAIAINGVKSQDDARMLNHKDAYHGRYIILKKGKKAYGLIDLSPSS
jgi:tyrosyl-tRNA synthetase